jgi:hypothetical protein
VGDESGECLEQGFHRFHFATLRLKAGDAEQAQLEFELAESFGAGLSIHALAIGGRRINR